MNSMKAIFQDMRACGSPRRLELGGERLLRYCARSIFAGERLLWVAGSGHWALSDTNYR